MQTGKTNAMNDGTHVNKLRNAKVQNQDYKYQINYFFWGSQLIIKKCTFLNFLLFCIHCMEFLVRVIA